MPPRKGKNAPSKETRTQKELAEAWDRSPEWIRQLTRKGILPTVKKGKRVAYPWPEVEQAYLDYRGKQGQRPQPSRKKKEKETITLNKLALACGCTPRWLQELAARGVIPTLKVGKRTAYPYPEAVLAFWEDKMASIEKVSTTLDQAKLRKMEAEAELAELKASEVRKELVPMGLFLEEVDSLFDLLRGRLMAVPGHWAPEIVGIKSVKAAVTTLRPLMAELIESLRDSVAEYGTSDPDN
jgi:hypothetical protein